MNGPKVGLGFDLSAWQAGIRDAGDLVKKGLSDPLLAPFNKAMDKAGVRIGGLGKLLAGLGTGVGLWKTVGFLEDAYKEAEASSRSMVKLKAALDSVGQGSALEGVKKLGENLRLAFGVGQSDTNDVYSSFITRMFDTKQAQELTILAAAYAQKAGKPIQEVSLKIADAANGNVDAIKELGVQVAVTGNRVTDAKAAVVALKAAYGGIGSDLVPQTQLLGAAWQDLKVTIGDQLGPAVDPLMKKMTDFVVGIKDTKEGKAALDDLRLTFEALGKTIDATVSKAAGFSKWWKEKSLRALAWEGRDVGIGLDNQVNKGVGGVLNALAWATNAQHGSPLRNMSDAYKKVIAQRNGEIQGEFDASLRDRKAYTQVADETAGSKDLYTAATEAGAAKSAGGTAAVGAEVAAGRGEGFAGGAARSYEQQKADAAAAEQLKSARAEQARLLERNNGAAGNAALAQAGAARAAVVAPAIYLQSDRSLSVRRGMRRR